MAHTAGCCDDDFSYDPDASMFDMAIALAARATITSRYAAANTDRCGKESADNDSGVYSDDDRNESDDEYVDGRTLLLWATHPNKAHNGIYKDADYNTDNATDSDDDDDTDSNGDDDGAIDGGNSGGGFSLDKGGWADNTDTIRTDNNIEPKRDEEKESVYSMDDHPQAATGDEERSNDGQEDKGQKQTEETQEEHADDKTKEIDAKREALLARCPVGAHKHPSAWQPMIDAYLDMLASVSNQTPPNSSSSASSSSAQGGNADTTDTDNARADESVDQDGYSNTRHALLRFLPTLVAHQLDVYDVVVSPEYTDCIRRRRDDDTWIAEAYCGVGDWIARVQCQRARIYDGRSMPEHVGGEIELVRLVHRYKRESVRCFYAPLGDGYRRETHEMFQFMRSGHLSYEAFLDACYGPLKRTPRALCRRFGWSLRGSTNDDDSGNDDSGGDAADDDGDHDNDDDDDGVWGDQFFAYPQSMLLVRDSDGVVVTLLCQGGALLVGVQDEPCRCLAPEAHRPSPLSGQDSPVAVPRPCTDYGQWVCEANAASQRDHADRTYLVECGLLDPMHMAPLGGHMKRRAYARRPCWPCTRFPCDVYAPMDAKAEANWQQRLVQQMESVADLIKHGAMGDLFVSGDDVRAAVGRASAQMATIAGPATVTMTRFDARALDTMAETMLSPMLSVPWRIHAPETFVRHGNRYVDPARGLYVNWNMRCNFVPSDRADGLIHARFYGHILVVDDSKCDRTTQRKPCSDDAQSTQRAPLTVVAYCALTLRSPRKRASYDPDGWPQNRSRDMVDMYDVERRDAVEAIMAAQLHMRSCFAPNEPHHVIDHYRRHELSPIPLDRFHGIAQEDAFRADPALPPADAVIRAFDWLRAIFDRHATVFGIAR